jgi:hypothetical protein
MINITAGYGKFCFIIRYNPDNIGNCNNKFNVEEKIRLKFLTERIDYYIKNPHLEPFVCEYLYYKYKSFITLFTFKIVK